MTQGADRSAEIARVIMLRKRERDDRQAVFDLVRCFHDVPPEQIIRGIRIALEIYEATEIEHVGK